MKVLRAFVVAGSLCGLTSCFSKEEKVPEPVVAAPKVIQKSVATEDGMNKDKSLSIFTRYFEQADAIHREAWWVLTAERRPVGKSPFGKIQRALLSSQNIKLSNKSMFRCDRYVVKRDVMGLDGFPQKGEVFEKCSEKTEAKKLADFSATSFSEIQVTFFPENLEEILGLGATVLNKHIQCTLRGNEKGQLSSLKCKDWAQDRNKEQMIRLDVYDYEQAGRNLIKLRGKVYENLSDIRKIEADVPLEGKILVTETELYAPTPTPTPSPTAKPTPSPSPKVNAERVPGAPPLELPPEGEEAPAPAGPAKITPLPGSPLPPPRVVDPDVLMQQGTFGAEPVVEPETQEAPPVEEPQEGVPHGR
ncbi:hypothetical protein [Bdellovibrio sp.]|uniref:hypothetical protein n=1 Tax=Bdellovibrio sp. TaxID=28201 RepID=UPI0039E3EFAE